MKEQTGHLAFCGFDCARCPVYAATAAGDETLMKALARRYAENGRQLDSRQMRCMGCGAQGVSEALCGGCEMRACCMQKGLAHCGRCQSYPCGVVERCLRAGTPGRARLDALANKTKGEGKL